MSSGQLLLTLGVALLVFDSKKIPQLFVDLAWLLAATRRHYSAWLVTWEQILQQAVAKKQLEQNNQKAQKIET